MVEAGPHQQRETGDGELRLRGIEQARRVLGYAGFALVWRSYDYLRTSPTCMFCCYIPPAIGLESLDFLLAKTYRSGHFDFIGNRGWYRRGSERAVLGQQPIEAAYTAEACLTAYEITKILRYQKLAQAATEWLLGRNRLGVSLYDPATGGFADGLDQQGVSMNQGAESVICGFLALLVVAEQREKWNEAGAEVIVMPSATSTSLMRIFGHRKLINERKPFS